MIRTRQVLTPRRKKLRVPGKGSAVRSSAEEPKPVIDGALVKGSDLRNHIIYYGSPLNLN